MVNLTVSTNYDEQALKSLYEMISLKSINGFIQIELENAFNKLNNSFPHKIRDNLKNFVKCFPKLDDLFAVVINKNRITLQYVVPVDKFNNYINEYEFGIVLKTNSDIIYGLKHTKINGYEKDHKCLSMPEVDTNFNININYMATPNEQVLATTTYPRKV